MVFRIVIWMYGIASVAITIKSGYVVNAVLRVVFLWLPCPTVFTDSFVYSLGQIEILTFWI